MKNTENIKKLLIVVDMVNGFTKEGVMQNAYMKDLIPEIDRLIKLFRKENNGVMFVKESHNNNSKEFKKFPRHCVEGESEALIVDEFQRYVDSENVYNKNSTCAIFAPRFMDDINSLNNLEEVVLVGGCTDICLMNAAIPLVNYFDENDKSVDVIVPINACDTYDSPLHNRNEYNEMAYKFMNQAGIKLVKKYK